MKLIRKSLAVGLAVAAATVAACSTGPHQTAPGTASNTNPSPTDTTQGTTDTTGAIGMQLTLPGGEHISKINYILTNGTNTLSGSYNVGQTATLSFVIGSVPAGSGYSLSISGTSDDGNYTCSYPAPGDPLTSNITVVNRTTTVVNVNLQCLNNQGQDSGSVLVNAVESNCPVWNTIVANPYNILIDGGQNVNNSGTQGATAFQNGASPLAIIQDGQQLVLVGSATAPNPGALTFTWTTTGGTISNAAGTLDPNSNDAGTTNQTVFTCPASAAATYTVTLTVSDGPLPDGGSCDMKWTTGTVQVQCTSLTPCAASGGNVAVPNSASGVCTSFPDTVLASAADSAMNWCCIPPPACPSGPFATPFPGGTCTGTLQNVGGCCVAPQPCTTPGQTGCVKCTGNTGSLNGACTLTEQIIVARDIAKNYLTGGQLNTTVGSASRSCYDCLWNSGCIDDQKNGDVGAECEDLGAALVGTGAQAAETKQLACRNTLNCIFPSGCQNAKAQNGAGATDGIENCFCGSNGITIPLCEAEPTIATGPASAAANGSCAQTEIDGLGLTTSTAITPLVNAFTTNTSGAGLANNIFLCAGSNAAVFTCPSCFQ